MIEKSCGTCSNSFIKKGIQRVLFNITDNCIFLSKTNKFLAWLHCEQISVPIIEMSLRDQSTKVPRKNKFFIQI